MLLNDDKTLVCLQIQRLLERCRNHRFSLGSKHGSLDQENELDLNDPHGRSTQRDATALPQYIGADAKIEKAFITQGCVVEGEVKNSVLFTGCKVGEGAKVIDSVLMPGVEVAAGAVVHVPLLPMALRSERSCCRQCRQRNIELVAKRVKGVE